MARRSLPKISMIGAGKVGSALALALHENGYSFASIISRSGKSAVALSKLVRCPSASTVVGDTSAESGIVLIATPDGAVREVAEALSRSKRLAFRKLFVAHTSGALSSGALSALKKKGAAVASIHPIQTFAEGTSRTSLRSKLRGISYGVEGDPRGAAEAEKLVNMLGGRAVSVPADLKPLYHAACVYASGYFLSLLNAVGEITLAAGLRASWTEIFGPLMTTTMDNAVRLSPRSALTGPAARGDLATLLLHLEALALHAPELLATYTVCGIDVARLARHEGRLSEEGYDGVLKLFRRFVNSPSFTTSSKVSQ